MPSVCVCVIVFSCVESTSKHTHARSFARPLCNRAIACATIVRFIILSRIIRPRPCGPRICPAYCLWKIFSYLPENVFSACAPLCTSSPGNNRSCCLSNERTHTFGVFALHWRAHTHTHTDSRRQRVCRLVWTDFDENTR